MLPPVATWWCEVSRRFFTRLCHNPDLEQRREISPVPTPAESELVALTKTAPPMRGGEHLSADMVARFWAGLDDLVRTEIARHTQSAGAWLKENHPLWRMVGRVTFHLAHNKRHPTHPFAFLASCTSRLSSQSRVQHLPLGRALQEYAGTGNKTALLNLLSPVQKAVEKSALVRELVESFQGDDGSPFFLLTVEAGGAVLNLTKAAHVIHFDRWWNPAVENQATDRAFRIGQKRNVLVHKFVCRSIARTFWGSAWCYNLESHMDYENRLPRGRAYVRNGSVVHLEILPGKVDAMVSGTELYGVTVNIAPAVETKWKKLCAECAGSIGSLIELLQGRFFEHVMSIPSRKETGLSPALAEIKLSCSCPAWATICKHVAAVLYGAGARLHQSPELLFTLRSVNCEELVSRAASVTDLAGRTDTAVPELAESETGAVFGIELDTTAAPAIASSAATPEPVPARCHRRCRKL